MSSMLKKSHQKELLNNCKWDAPESFHEEESFWGIIGPYSTYGEGKGYGKS